MEYTGHGHEAGHDTGVGFPPTPLSYAHTHGNEPAAAETRYRECLRNHAAAQGGHALDGCGEFMPASADDSLRCAACGCHRSFHRRGSSPRAPLLPPHRQPQPQQQRSSFPCRAPSGGATTESSSEERRGPPPAQAPRKRFRTSFTRDQKEQMLGFAERLGWRMQKQDEAMVEQFCVQVGVRRQALKVWMHNNKHSRRQKLQELEKQRQQQ